MSSNDFNIGSDAKITVLVDGAPLGATILTSFAAKQETAKLKSIAIDGVNRNRHVAQGWSGTLKYDRTNGLLDDFFAANEAAQYAGLPPPVINIFASMRNVDDGSVSRYRFEDVAITLDDAGSYEGDKTVSQSASWDASRRIKVG